MPENYPDNMNNMQPGIPQRYTPSMRLQDAGENEIKIFGSFLRELTDDDDAPPVFACRDAQYFLTLQREKMKENGITVTEQLHEAGALDKITGMLYDSMCYTSHRLFKGYDRRSTYYLNGRKIFSYRDRVNLYQMLINAKSGLPHNASCICPNCGGISTIAELEKGCKYCGTRFLMSELFPKVTEHFWLHDYSFSKRDMNMRMLSYIVGGTALGALLGIILNFTEFWRTYAETVGMKVSAIIFFMILGVFTGFFASLSVLFWRVMIDAVRSLPLLSRTMGDRKRLQEFMNRGDPYFFYEGFESRAVSLFKIMVYGKNLSDNAAYCGSEPVPQSDVIDAVFKALDVETTDTDGKFVRITANIIADCLHFRHGRIKRKENEYKMVIVRNIYTVTDQGFSIIKVECPSCGASFDATRTKRCPYCGRDYHLTDYDWAVASFKKIK